MKKITLLIIGIFTLVMSTLTIEAAGGSSPVLTLIGGAEIYYEVGATYFEHGATATDSEDGNITSSIVIDSSAVNTTANGTYIVTYTVTDADENTAIAQRTIQVGKSISSEKVNDYSLLTNSGDSSYNYYSDVQALPDGSFAAVGRTFDSYYYTKPVMNVIRNGEIQYSDANFYHGYNQEGWNKLIVNSSNNIYTIGSNNNSYGGIGLFTSSSLVTKTYYTTRRGQFRSVAEIDTNKYAIYDTQYNYIYIFSGTTYQRYFSISGSMVDITSNMDDYIYIKTQNGTTASINKISSTGTTVWTKVIPDTIIAELGFINNELTLVGTTTNTVDTSIAKTNGGQDGIVIKLDQDGNILTSKTYGGKGNDTFDLANFNSNSIAIKYNSSSIDGTLEQTSKGLIVINASNLNSFNKSFYSSEFSYLNGIAINEDGVIALAGGNGIGGNLSRLRLVEVEPIYAIGFEDNSIDYGSSFDPELNTKFVDNFGNELNKIITSIEGSVNTTVVGNHVIYYNLSVLTESGYKNLRLKRTITVVPTLNINEGDIFSGSVPLNINGGTISINGNPYTKGDTYNIPGNSVLEITGINGYVKTINFSVDLIQSGIIEGYQYAEPVALTFSGGTATLNGNLYISGTVITEKGNHEIVITGANGFTETITFSILPVVLNVENNGVYLETITPNINAENMTLNGSVYNNEPIVNAGNYQLVITGVGGYVETLNFIIETTITGVVEDASYDGSVEVNYTKGTGTLNGNPFSSGDVITNPGDNTITITGESGYTKTVSFVVNLVTTELTNGAVYNPSLTPTFSGGTISLNGNPYLSGELIEIPGFYTLVVSGETGYSKTYYFNVEPEFVNVINGQTYYEPRVVANSKGNVTLNGNPYVSNTILNTSGSYTLQIVGAGGYLRTINFTMAGGSNVIDNESYILEHTIYFIGDATLDGVSISSGHVVNLVGNHTFELVDGTYTESKTFTIIPDYAPYNQDIFMNHTINIHNASLSLDGVAIANTLEISSVGTYSLTVNGVNGYTNTINFDVLPSVNVTNEMTYEEAFNLVTLGGTATLNGESFDGDGLLTTVGKYTLTITGHGSYTETWVFYIKPTITNLQEEGLYIDSVMPIINHDSLLLDGITYVSGTIIDSEGFHTLSILGSNGYQLDIMFIIVTSQLGIEDGMTYIESVSIESTVFDMTVNGISYTSGTSINTLGVNTLELSDGTKTKEITFYIIPTLINIEEGGTYVGSVTPIINHNNLLLNSALYQSGTPISSVGNHVLKVVNIGSGSTLYTFEISFKVIENPVNITIGGEYTGAVTPNVPNVQSLKLDGVAYSNNTTISTVGNHTLMIYGLNGYESQIDFIIHPTISNISDLGVYTSSVNAVIPNATLLLDGNAYTSGGIINQVGYHELIINGTNGYSKTLNFTILPNIQNVIDGGVYLSNSPKAPVVNYAESLALNGDTFISGTTVNMVGNYVLTVYGTGGYEYSISFVFNFVLTGITDGGQYTGSARPVVANATLDLNGLPHTSNTTIYDVGNHFLTINGVGGYSEVVSFTILPSISGVSANSTYTSTINIIINNVSGLTLNDSVFTSGSSVSALGNYTLKIYGINGYEQSIDFIIDIPTLSVVDSTTYTSARTIIVNNATSITLNGDVFTSGDTISTLGNYTLVVYGLNGFERTIDFVITHPQLPVTNDSVFTTAKTINLTTATSMTLNGSVFESGTTITRIGYYELIIYGEGGYQSIISFTKTLSTINVANTVYTTSVTPNIQNADLTLNGEIYINQTTISYAGNYQLVISGEGGWIRVIEFTIAPSITGIANGTNYTQSVIPNIPNATLMLNGETYENQTPISYVGDYNLTVYGAGGFEQVVSFTIRPTITGVVDTQSYMGEVYIDTIYDYLYEVDTYNITIDDVPYDLGTSYQLVGAHTLSVKGINSYEYTLSFIINEVPVGLADNTIYSGSLSFDIPNASLELNSQPFQNGDLVTQVGHHILVVNGSNGYQEIYEFTITEVVENLLNNEIYSYEVTPNIPNAELVLDGMPYQSNTPIKKVGNHTLEVIGTNGYKNVYEFTVTEKLFGITDNMISDTPVAIVFSDIDELTVNGLAKTSPLSVSQVGNYVILVKGTNGYINEYQFTINLKSSNVVDNGTYIGFANPIFNASSITLNGNPYVSGTPIQTIGHHTMEVFGAGGYSEVFAFTIEPIINGVVDGGIYTNSVKPNITNAQSLLLNGNEYDNSTLITDAGNYELTIVGINGYQKTMSFIIEHNLDITYSSTSNGIYYEWVRLMSTNSDIKITQESSPSNDVTIGDIGLYQVEIIGKGGYSKSQLIEIGYQISNKTENDIYNAGFTPVILGGATLYLNGLPYTKGTTIEMAGNQVLTFTGANGYTKDYLFTLEPSVDIIEVGFNIEVSVTAHLNAKIDNQVVDLTGKYLDQNVGNHFLVVYGLNGWSKTYNYTVDANISVEEVSPASYKVNVLNQATAIRVNDILYYGDIITRAGTKNISVYGANNYVKTTSFDVEPYLDGIVEGEVFEGTVSFTTSNADVVISGVRVQPHQLYTIVGNHQVVLKGDNGYESEPIQIRVRPVYEGIVHEGEYKNSVSYVIKGATSIELNGVNVYAQGVIRTIGYNEITVNGVNGFSETINVTVTANTNHLTDQTGLDSLIRVNNAEKLVLNGIEVNSDYVISKYGNYNLIIDGVNGYMEEVNFIVPFEYMVEENQEYINEATLIATRISVKVNGETPTSTRIFDIGNYTIEYFGEGNYYHKRHFVINPQLNIKNNYHYEGEISIILPDNAIYLWNNKTISSGTFKVNQVGKHTLAVLGPNNFKLEYSFFVDPLLTIKDGESFDTPKELEMINATMYLNGKLVTEDTTDFKHGENVLTIKGTGDYEDIQIRFNYTNRNVENSLFIGIPTASITLVAAIWFFIRRRKVI